MIFLAVSGVTATRVSPAAVSAGTPINMVFSSTQWARIIADSQNALKEGILHHD
jgi:hypothetical protein